MGLCVSSGDAKGAVIHLTLHLALRFGCYMKPFFREEGAAPGHPGEDFSQRRPASHHARVRSGPGDLSQDAFEKCSNFDVILA